MNSFSIKNSAAPLLFGILTACHSVGPDFHEPPTTDTGTAYAVPVSGRVLLLKAVNADRAGTHYAKWWQCFRAPKVDILLSEALLHNQDVAAAQANLEQAQDLLRATGGDSYPQVDMQANVGRSRYGAEFLGPMPKPPAFNYFALGPTISYTLDYTGAIARSQEEQRALVDFAKEQLRAIQLKVAGEVLFSLIRLAQLQDTQAIIAQLQADDAARLKFWQQAVQAGGAAHSSLDQMDAQSVGDEQTLHKLQHDYERTLEALSVLLGRAPDAHTDPRLSLTQLSLPEQLPLTVASQLIRQRPDIRAAEAQLHAATAAVGVASARLYPQITVQANYSQQSTDPGHLWSLASESWGLGAGLTEPIVNRTRLLQEKAATRAVLRNRWAQYRKTVLAAFVQVSQVLQNLDNDREDLISQQRLEKITQRGVAEQQVSKVNGGSSSLALLEAQYRVHQQQVQWVNTRTALYFDTVRFYLSMGSEEDLLPH